MSRWSLTLALPLFAIAAPAVAQPDDLDSWSGFYVGADLGLSSGKLHASGTDSVFQLTNIDPPGTQPLTIVPGRTLDYSGSDHQSDVLYGATAGFLFGSGNWLFGVEGDAHGPRDSGSLIQSSPKPATALEPNGTLTVARDARISWDWSVRARAGYTWGPSMMYAAGGVAQTRLRLRGDDTYFVPTGLAGGGSTFTPPTIGPVVISSNEHGTLTGWTAGIGGEHHVASHISIGLDGRYTDYGSQTIDLAGCDPNSTGLAQCGNATISGAGTLTFPAGTNPATISPNSASPYPGAAPGVTRVSLNEWRLSMRIIFRF